MDQFDSNFIITELLTNGINSVPTKNLATVPARIFVTITICLIPNFKQIFHGFYSLIISRRAAIRVRAPPPPRGGHFHGDSRQASFCRRGYAPAPAPAPGWVPTPLPFLLQPPLNPVRVRACRLAVRSPRVVLRFKSLTHSDSFWKLCLYVTVHLRACSSSDLVHARACARASRVRIWIVLLQH